MIFAKPPPTTTFWMSRRSAAGKSSASVGSHEEFRELLKNAVQENQQGVSLEIDMVVVAGRKAVN